MSKKKAWLTPAVEGARAAAPRTSVTACSPSALAGSPHGSLQAAAQGNSHIPPLPGGQARLKVTTWSTSARMPIHSPTVWL